MLCARDIMTETVVTLSENLSLNEVKRIFYRQNISGAPVVDGNGRVIGVISKSDLMREQMALAAHVLASHGFDLNSGQSDTLNEDTLIRPDSMVGDFITRRVISATPETPVRQLARLMLHHNIHRLIITSPDNGEPVGVVSSFDMMRAMLMDDNSQPHELIDVIDELDDPNDTWQAA